MEQASFCLKRAENEVAKNAKTKCEQIEEMIFNDCIAGMTRSIFNSRSTKVRSGESHEKGLKTAR